MRDTYFKQRVFAVPLPDPERELGMREVPIGRWYEPAVEGMAVDVERRLRTGDGEREPVPRAVRQSEGESLDARGRAAGRHVVQPHLVAAPARLHFQVPAHHRTLLTQYRTRETAVRAARSRPRLFRGTHTQTNTTHYIRTATVDGAGPTVSGPRLALHLNIARSL